MQKLTLSQSQQQRLSPQQIQFIKLLQIPTADLDQRIEEELEINPALEEGKEEEIEDFADDNYEDDYNDDYDNEKIDVQDYLNKDDYAGYKTQSEGWEEEDKYGIPISEFETINQRLIQQLGFLKLNEKQTQIGEQLIGSIEDDGYIRRPIKAIGNDLAFGQNLYCSEEEIVEVLSKIQKFDPPGIACRDLQECLLIQLEKQDDDFNDNTLAIQIIEDCFEEFTKKHYSKISKKLGISEEELKEPLAKILRLNPRPGNMSTGDKPAAYLMPDFIVSGSADNLEISLNSKNAPELKISRSFTELMQDYDKSDKSNKRMKETVTFVKQKLDAAKWFIDAIKQRQQTLLKTMEAIVKYQEEFFFEGDENKLKPMILKDIADKIGMDISTISRVANSKGVQTDFGIYPLKYFFSEGISTDSGEDASSREVKNILKGIIDTENKRAPLSDDKLEKLLREKGYNIARRTVAKYREQLSIPVARLRKELI